MAAIETVATDRLGGHANQRVSPCLPVCALTDLDRGVDFASFERAVEVIVHARLDDISAVRTAHRGVWNHAQKGTARAHHSRRAVHPISAVADLCAHVDLGGVEHAVSIVVVARFDAISAVGAPDRGASDDANQRVNAISTSRSRLPRRPRVTWVSLRAAFSWVSLRPWLASFSAFPLWSLRAALGHRRTKRDRVLVAALDGDGAVLVLRGRAPCGVAGGRDATGEQRGENATGDQELPGTCHHLLTQPGVGRSRGAAPRCRSSRVVEIHGSSGWRASRARCLLIVGPGTCRG